MAITITATSNGPFRISSEDAARLTILDTRGDVVAADNPQAPVELCRCGQSASKPFCDGTHATIGFTDRE